MESALTGDALLAKHKELKAEGATTSELVRYCGYVSELKSGAERLNFTAYYKAMVDAMGMGDSSKKPGSSGELGFLVTVGRKSENIVVGKRYGQLLGVNPGDVLAIKVTKKNITLTPVNPVEQEDGDETQQA
jgi:hypothetical protein